jgi:thioredoxin 2
VPCTLCGAANRLPIARLDERARCGHCRSSLLNGNVAAVAAARLTRLVRVCDLPLVVQVTSPRVPPERRRDSDLDELARSLRSAALFVRVDADREPGVLFELGVSAVPSLALAIGGRVVSRLSGALDLAALQRWIALHTLDALHAAEAQPH